MIYLPETRKNYRQDKISSIIQQILALYFIQHSFSHPMLEHSIITIANVQVSPNLKKYLVTVVFSDFEHTKQKVILLNKNTFLFQKILNKKLKLKYTPSIEFITEKK